MPGTATSKGTDGAGSGEAGRAALGDRRAALTQPLWTKLGLQPVSGLRSVLAGVCVLQRRPWFGYNKVSKPCWHEVLRKLATGSAATDWSTCRLTVQRTQKPLPVHSSSFHLPPGCGPGRIRTPLGHSRKLPAQGGCLPITSWSSHGARLVQPPGKLLQHHAAQTAVAMVLERIPCGDTEGPPLSFSSSSGPETSVCVCVRASVSSQMTSRTVVVLLLLLLGCLELQSPYSTKGSSWQCREPGRPLPKGPQAL